MEVTEGSNPFGPIVTRKNQDFAPFNLREYSLKLKIDVGGGVFKRQRRQAVNLLAKVFVGSSPTASIAILIPLLWLNL
jgi:hypothetical protein